jgi:hypothetical protein
MTLPVQSLRRSDAAGFTPYHLLRVQRWGAVLLPSLRDRAAAMASTHCGDVQPMPAPGMARHRAPVVACGCDGEHLSEADGALADWTPWLIFRWITACRKARSAALSWVRCPESPERPRALFF